MTFFSPCHAGCHKWNEKERFYSDCSCAPVSERLMYAPEITTTMRFPDKSFDKGAYKKMPDSYEMTYDDDDETTLSSILPSVVLSSTMETPTSFSISDSSTKKTTLKPRKSSNNDDYSLYDDYTDEYYNSETKSRQTRETDESLSVMLSGACMKGCAIGFYLFTSVSAFINIFGASGRIGNLLVNYR